MSGGRVGDQWEVMTPSLQRHQCNRERLGMESVHVQVLRTTVSDLSAMLRVTTETTAFILPLGASLGSSEIFFQEY